MADGSPGLMPPSSPLPPKSSQASEPIRPPIASSREDDDICGLSFEATPAPASPDMKQTPDAGETVTCPVTGRISKRLYSGRAHWIDTSACERARAVVELFELNEDYQPDDGRKDFQVLGCGTFGVVIAATDPEGRRVALKKQSVLPDLNSRLQLRELQLMRHFSAKGGRGAAHPNMLQIHDILRPREWVTPGGDSAVYFTMDRMDTDLWRIISRQEDFQGASAPPLTDGLVRRLFRHLLLGCKAMHEAGVMHRDLKPENLLVRLNGPGSPQLKVADLGSARRAGSSGQTMTVCTVCYRAPELLMGYPDYSLAVDMWSCGVIFAEMVRATIGGAFPMSGNPLWLRLLRPQICDERVPQFAVVILRELVNMLGAPDDDDIRGAPGFVSGFQKYLQKYRRTANGSAPKAGYGLTDKEQLQPPEGKTLAPGAEQLIARLLVWNPETRLTAAAALQDPYFGEEAAAVEPMNMVPSGEWATFEAPAEDSDTDMAGQIAAMLGHEIDLFHPGFLEEHGRAPVCQSKRGSVSDLPMTPRSTRPAVRMPGISVKLVADRDGDEEGTPFWQHAEQARNQLPPDRRLPNDTPAEMLQHEGGELVCVRIAEDKEGYVHADCIARVYHTREGTDEDSQRGRRGSGVPFLRERSGPGTRHYPPMHTFSSDASFAVRNSLPVEFYGYTSPMYRELASFFPVNFDAMEHTFPSLEHFFQAMKFHHSEEHFNEVRSAGTAEAAREMGTSRSRPLRPGWDNIKEQVLYEGMLEKFSQNARCREVLLSTGDSVLRFKDERDSYWGTGQDGLGLNKYGELLMEVRDELRWQQICPGGRAGRERMYAPLPLQFYGYAAHCGELNSYFPSPFDWGGQTFPTLEHFFQAMKFEKSAPHRFEAIRTASLAREAADLGRRRDVPLRKDWDSVRLRVFVDGLKAKFTQNPHCLKVLMSTGRRDLHFADPTDGFWGTGPDGKGKNVYGKLLQKVRNLLQWRQEVGIIQKTAVQELALQVQHEILSAGDNVQQWPRVKQIGVGSGKTECYEIITLPSALHIAAKVVPIDDQARGQLEELEQEIQVIKSLHHPHVVSYFGSYHDSARSQLYIFMELGQGNLSTAVNEVSKHMPGKRLTLDVVRSYAAQILRGLAYLHCNDIAHRDVKATNVLMGNAGEAKLADFGTAGRVRRIGTSKEGIFYDATIGTLRWSAPEVLEQVHKGRRDLSISIKADVWSLGCTVLEMLATEPWTDLGDMGLLEQVSEIVHRGESPLPENPKRWPPQLHGDSSGSMHGTAAAFSHFLIDKCFCRVPERRPTAEDLLQHPFITQPPQRDD